MPVKISGSIGIISNSQLAKFDDESVRSAKENLQLNQIINKINAQDKKLQGLLPSAITRKRKKQLEKGLGGGRLEESTIKTKDARIRPTFTQRKQSLTNDFLLAFGIKNPKKLAEASLVSATGAPLKRFNEFNALRKDVGNLKKTQGAIAKMISGSIPLVSGASALQSTRGIYNSLFGLVGRIGFPAIIITMLVTKIYKQYKAMYGKGGTRDIRKLIKAGDISLIGVENDNFLASGEILFLSNPNVLQGLSKGSSNTENIRTDISRFKQRHEGTYV